MDSTKQKQVFLADGKRIIADAIVNMQSKPGPKPSSKEQFEVTYTKDGSAARHTVQVNEATYNDLRPGHAAYIDELVHGPDRHQ